MEAETLANNLIISGSLVPDFHHGENPKEVVRALIKDHLKIVMPSDNIAVAHRLGKPASTGRVKNKIMVRFHRKEDKKNIIIANIKMRVNELFINEELTQQANKMYYDNRKLRKDNRDSIAILYTRDGVICARKTKEGLMHHILTEEDLKTFLHAAGLQYQPTVSA